MELNLSPRVVLEPPCFWVDENGKGHLGALRDQSQAPRHATYNLRRDRTIGYIDMIGGSNRRRVPHVYLFSVGRTALLASATMGVRLHEPREVRWGEGGSGLLVVYDRNIGEDELLEQHTKRLGVLGMDELEELHTNRIGSLFRALVQFAPDGILLPPELEDLPR